MSLINIVQSIKIGQPIAWCLSDQETTEVMKCFLSIKDNSPQLQDQYYMTGNCLNMHNLNCDQF